MSKWQFRCMPDNTIQVFPRCERRDRLYTLSQSDLTILRVLDSQYDFPALLDAYFEGWAVDNRYGEIKHDMLEDKILLCSQSVEEGEQAIWGHTHCLRSGAFMMALRDIQDEFMWCAITSPDSVPTKLRVMRDTYWLNQKTAQITNRSYEQDSHSGSLPTP